ncbi:alpha/beta hydrolase [Fimbriiglobus ruber]|uniref:Serine aminopeptidase S33 domain-containing protein n=1 Tax=Fimbriiglobus ruber TaxID=1908690 RepID=A0A225DPP2_9BACT|nr:alpha/beta fold hydrolase [Fimbriiglobus ruber]OWK38147.1 hypothetical protein FRUB_07267 [Fimbriiglobus ruber]
MPDWFWWTIITAVAVVKLAALGVILTIQHYRRLYTDQIARIFEERPLFVIPRGAPVDGSEEVGFPTSDGLFLRGVYLKTVAPRKGVILFGLEFGSNRWAASQYCGRLVEAGYDVFAFEPRNQGESEKDKSYSPLQWVTDKDLADMRAAVAYLKARLRAEDDDAAADGIGLFGISKGASVGLLVAADEPWIKCVATDGAYATYTTMVPYMRKWVGLYSPAKRLQEMIPNWFYGAIGTAAIQKVAVRRAVQFLSVERALKSVRQPLLMIHGQADAYIKPAMAQKLFDRAASQRKWLWVVPGAKHNQALHVAGSEYTATLTRFFDSHIEGASGDSGTFLSPIAPAAAKQKLVAGGS